jgi:hypothetical protein
MIAARYDHLNEPRDAAAFHEAAAFSLRRCGRSEAAAIGLRGMLSPKRLGGQG